MQPGQTALERAFALAKSGEFPNVALIRQRLNHEGYSGSQIEGPELAKQLREIISQARAALPPDGEGGDRAVGAGKRTAGQAAASPARAKERRPKSSNPAAAAKKTAHKGPMA